jgi:hypothetical protein
MIAEWEQTICVETTVALKCEERNKDAMTRRKDHWDHLDRLGDDVE